MASDFFKRQQQSDLQGTHNKQTINDPKAVNILAYTLGGSVLLASVGGIYYRRKQHLNNNGTNNN